MEGEVSNRKPNLEKKHQQDSQDFFPFSSSGLGGALGMHQVPHMKGPEKKITTTF